MTAAMIVAASTIVAIQATSGGEPASAANASQFDPGNIISDPVFFDGGAMSPAEVQAFLNSMVPSCRAGYTCLKDYRQDTPSRPVESGRCFDYRGAPGESAATIIARVGVACGVSQKVLIVLLEKEQGLVSDTWPTSRQYRSATGYGCPDTADCDSAYYGFFNQVYMAALQFKRYAANPGGYNHVARAVNWVRYHPNAACGSSQIYIHNQATAGLYNYTPYRPNAAALANLYGTGDSCSSYGNRNFWRMYSDWFGDPTVGSTLVRTASNPTVYVIGRDMKYPVPDMVTFNDLSRLGALGYVSDAYLARFPTGQMAGRVIRAPGGGMYLYDAGSKLPFVSCQQVVDYGAACAPTGYMQLTDGQVAKYATGPALTSVMRTIQGGSYHVSEGIKREILDDASAAAAGIATVGSPILTENSIGSLPLGPPITRDSAFVGVRGASVYYLLADGRKYLVPAQAAGWYGLPPLLSGRLRDDSLAAIASSSAPFTGAVRAPGSTESQFLTPSGRFAWAPDAVGGSRPYANVSAAFLNRYPLDGTVTVGSFLKIPGSQTVYLVQRDSLRPFGSYAALLSLSAAPVIVQVAPPAITGLPIGPPITLPSGSLVRTADNPSVYLINGLAERIPVADLDVTSQAGITGVQYVQPATLDSYPSTEMPLSYLLQCGSSRYLSAGGALHVVSSELVAAYGGTPTPLTDAVCARLKIGAPATPFIRTANGSIYQLDAGVRRPVTTWARFAELGGPAVGYTGVSDAYAATLPLGLAA